MTNFPSQKRRPWEFPNLSLHSKFIWKLENLSHNDKKKNQFKYFPPENAFLEIFKSRGKIPTKRPF